jgi:hypothetical protein
VKPPRWSDDVAVAKFVSLILDNEDGAFWAAMALEEALREYPPEAFRKTAEEIESEAIAAAERGGFSPLAAMVRGGAKLSAKARALVAAKLDGTFKARRGRPKRTIDALYDDWKPEAAGEVRRIAAPADGATTDDFIQDLRGRVLGAPEISTDGWPSYGLSIRDAFRNSAHGVIVKTLAVTDLRKDAAHRYSPCAAVAVSREAMQGVPAEISTSYVERSNLSVRMASRRFTRLTNGFSKKLENHAAAVSLYVAHYNFCRVHESLTPDARRRWHSGSRTMCGRSASYWTRRLQLPRRNRPRRHRSVGGGSG